MFRIQQTQDARKPFVSKIALVGGPFSGLEPVGCRIVLNDVVVPIQYPNIAVRSDLRHDWGGPIIDTGYCVVSVLAAVSGAVLL